MYIYVPRKVRHCYYCENQQPKPCNRQNDANLPTVETKATFSLRKLQQQGQRLI